MPPIAFAYLRHKSAAKRMIFPKWTVPVVGDVIVAELCQLRYFAETSAISVGSTSIVFPLISAYPIITTFGVRLVLYERLSPADWVLLGFVVLGIELTSIV